MLTFLWSLGAFIVALGILVAVHEWGHFIVARICGVHVERFSIGFGKPFWRRTDSKGTEFAIAAIPLGGYVRMLDERVDSVPAELKHKAFNNKSVGKRMAIIAAGPGVNFLFAILALVIMFLIGQNTVKPVIGDIAADSYAAKGGLNVGDEIIQIGEQRTVDWEAVNMELVASIGHEQINISVKNGEGLTKHQVLPLTGWNFDPEKQSALDSVGIIPFRPAPTLTLGLVSKGSPAEQAGLKAKDELQELNGKPVDNWQQFVDQIVELPGETVEISILRDGQEQVINATIARRDTPEGQSGFLGVSPLSEPWPDGYVFNHQYGLVEAITHSVSKTWRLMVLSVDMLGKLVTGDVSINNLSGPISIAQGAGISAGYGLVYFLNFLALISVSLGIINLLPIPMLDGGHLLYFTIEWLTGKPVSEAVQEWGFRIGGMLLLTIMSIAIFNDISRIA
ncbi:sigma E protease regulator RseP [Alteromonas pelagimontana]|uniref:Zinc metalloprotease n=1 Tax=Alteromonas pelagimontana TaxID=1858656 RepID=A0A6M4MFX2_9ALTE|nr:sigma E protease regulator RseP [Alteromonas pelagimontana]QJR81778.1 sigma E protease regulator RseP [Alteromonas pelagimontana]